jgi:SulP family sulfate permease
VLTSLVALVAGAMLIAARILRAGFLADFLSRTVLVGSSPESDFRLRWVNLHGMLGLPKMGHGFFSQLFAVAQHASEIHLSSVLISSVVLTIVIGSEWISPRFPGALVAVAGMIAASAW